jgi:methionine-rich copper-binding protein CopC
MNKKVILLAFLLIIPLHANAHVMLMESYPAKNAVLEESPSKVTLTFMGAMEPEFSRVEVFDKDGNKVSKKSKCTLKKRILEAELVEGLTSGEYTVEWFCLGMDGHKSKGSYKFLIN